MISADPLEYVRRHPDVEAKEIEKARGGAIAQLRTRLGALRQVDDGRYQAPYVDGERKKILVEWDAVNAKARAALAAWRERQARDAERRLAEGSPLSESDVAEAALIVRQYEAAGVTERRRFVGQEAARLASIGAYAKSRQLHRAAEALGVADGEPARLLNRADPIRKAARVELDTLVSMEGAFERQLLEERDAEGLLTASESVRLKVSQPTAGAE